MHILYHKNRCKPFATVARTFHSEGDTLAACTKESGNYVHWWCESNKLKWPAHSATSFFLAEKLVSTLCNWLLLTYPIHLKPSWSLQSQLIWIFVPLSNGVYHTSFKQVNTNWPASKHISQGTCSKGSCKCTMQESILYVLGAWTHWTHWYT